MGYPYPNFAYVLFWALVWGFEFRGLGFRALGFEV